MWQSTYRAASLHGREIFSLREKETAGGRPEPEIRTRETRINQTKSKPNQTMKLNTLADLLHHELKDLYSAENQLVEALPEMAEAATNPQLKAGFEEHLEQTMGHVERLEEIAEKLGLKLGGHKCKAMEGLIKEGSELIEEDADERVRDAGLIGAAQRVEHYEIAGYGTARALARRLGHEEVADILTETLNEEKDTDMKLTELAESAVNAEAQAASGDHK